MEDNNKVTLKRGFPGQKASVQATLRWRGREGGAMAFPEPKPRGPELPQKRLKTLDCGQRAVRAVRFNVDGNYCLTCGSDKTLKLWSPLRGTLLRTYSGHGYEVLDAAGSFDNSSLCSGGGDKAVVLWDVASGQVVRKFRGHAGKVNTVQFNEEATVILSGSIDSTIRCWDCRSRRPEPIQKLDEAKDGISSVKVSDHEVLAGAAQMLPQPEGVPIPPLGAFGLRGLLAYPVPTHPPLDCTWLAPSHPQVPIQTSPPRGADYPQSARLHVGSKCSWLGRSCVPSSHTGL
ncbi:WD repeat domain-containing protein 83 isoform 3-T3 [Megaptera novaeangliae]